MGSFTKKDNTGPADETPAIFLQLRRIEAHFFSPLVAFLLGKYTYLCFAAPGKLLWRDED